MPAAISKADDYLAARNDIEADDNGNSPAKRGLAKRSAAMYSQMAPDHARAFGLGMPPVVAKRTG